MLPEVVVKVTPPDYTAIILLVCYRQEAALWHLKRLLNKMFSSDGKVQHLFNTLLFL
jgi:hypothetical protein